MNNLNSLEVQCNQPNCPRKGEMMKYETFVKYHPEECIIKKVPCPNLCGKLVTKQAQKDIQVHLGNYLNRLEEDN